jgi:hypothetical protein
MEKLTQISNKIKNNYSYTGKGKFEDIVRLNKDDILKWLKQLIPLQQQIIMLQEKENVTIQKRNYIRILTKFFPPQYKEFVSLNILLRDMKTIQEYYKEQLELPKLYNQLISNKYLKYPGKNDNFVQFQIFEEFIDTYKDDIIISYIPQTTKQESIKTNTEKDIQKPETTKKDINWTNLLLGR